MQTDLKLSVAILGTGNIGMDLLVKCVRSPFLECNLFTGRNLQSARMKKATSLGVAISDGGINTIMENPGICDLVFDATSAEAHRQHWPILKNLGKKVVDLTPSSLGVMIVPVINLIDIFSHDNVNLISCGGQASIPLASAIANTHEHVEYIEVVSAIASKSAGPGTRENIDEYVETTESAIKLFSGCDRAKSILILNPAEPCINMQTTVYAKVAEPNLDALKREVDALALKIRNYVPGYRIVVPPVLEEDRIIITVRIWGQADYLPRYAGNLDIINCGAITIAEEYAKQITRQSMRTTG